MGDVLYRPLIEDMTWSYSRLDCFDQCKYRWFMKYIRSLPEEPQFYASYGKFMHKLIEMFYKGEVGKEDMKMVFLTGFSKEVEGARPSDTIVQNYIKKGLAYLDEFSEFPYNPVDVEMRIEFTIGGKSFVGIIDYLGEKDGEYYIVDNKSRDLKPRSKRKKPTKKDEELDDMLKQLYIYAGAVKQKYGKYPVALCFNCFKSGVFIEEPFNIDRYREVINWAECLMEKIMDEESFRPNMEFFNCTYICGLSHECEYWQNR